MMQTTSVRRIVCAATTTVAPKTAAPKRTLKALNLTKSNLVNSQGGRYTKNMDGVIYEMVYNSADDSITVIERKNQIQYPVVVGEKDNRISIAIEEPIYLTSTPNFEQLQDVLRGDSPAVEVLNGRVAMLAFLGCTAVEVATQRSFVEQALSPAGAAAAAALVALTTAASLAPALAGKQRVDRVFASVNDSYPDSQLPYYFHPLAELINGRAAMVGLLAVVGYELVKGHPLL